MKKQLFLVVFACCYAAGLLAKNGETGKTMSILFVTTNAGKFEEVRRWIKQLDPSIVLEQAPIDLAEYQSLDIHEVAVGKAEQAWKLLQKPLLIDDGGIYLEHYNKFPGTLAKYVYEGIGLDGIWKLAQDDPRAYFLSCIIYKHSPDTHYIFEGTCYGKMIKPDAHAQAHASLPYTRMFIPNDSSKTLAQLRGTEEEKLYHHRYKSLSRFVEWLKNNKECAD